MKCEVELFEFGDALLGVEVIKCKVLFRSYYFQSHVVLNAVLPFVRERTA